MLATDRSHWTLLDGLIHTGQALVRTPDHVGIAIVTHLEDLGANLGAKPTARAQIMIHFNRHDTSFLWPDYSTEAQAVQVG